MNGVVQIFSQIRHEAISCDEANTVEQKHSIGNGRNDLMLGSWCVGRQEVRHIFPIVSFIYKIACNL